MLLDACVCLRREEADDEVDDDNGENDDNQTDNGIEDLPPCGAGGLFITAGDNQAEAGDDNDDDGDDGDNTQEYVYQAQESGHNFGVAGDSAGQP